MTIPESATLPGEKPRNSFIDDLTTFATEHRAQHWRGTFAEFLNDILPQQPAAPRPRPDWT